MTGVTPTRCTRMRVHARRLAAIVARSAPGRRAPWLAAIVGRRHRLRNLEHYPENHVIDPATGAQFFVHAHDVNLNGFAHFHCFVRLPGRRFGLSRKIVTAHIAAVAVDEQGWPVRLLTVNQWVTGEYWQPARRTLALLDHLRFHARTPQGESGRWLESLRHIYWPELRRLLEARDRRLQHRLDRNPGKNVVQDRRLEVLSNVPIDLQKRLRALGTR